MELLDRPDAEIGCPNRDTIADFNAGRLTEGQLEAVAAHLSCCARCERVYREVARESSGDGLGRCLRRELSVPTASDEPAYAAMMAAARAIGLADGGSDIPLDVTHTPSPPRAHAPLPTAVGPYRILAVLGRGGMGVVYAAVHEVLNRSVALKMIRDAGSAPDAVLTRFRTEGEAIARLRHPNVVHVHHFDEWGGNPYLTMELLEGGSLDAKLRADGVMDARPAVELVRTLAAAVQYAHDRRVVHRDLKPSNVMLAADGTPKITDFGLAKILDDGRDGPTFTDAVIGTPSYMAPEQASGRTAEVGPLSDVYALGAILYECLTGVPPFLGENKIRTLEQVVRDPVRPPSAVRPDIPAEVEAICLKCLEKAPAKRYSCAKELKEDLGRWLDGELTVARPPGWMFRNRYRLRSGAALSAGFVTLTAGFMAYRSLDPDYRARVASAQLDRGESVTLIGSRTVSPYMRPIFEGHNVTITRDVGGITRVECPSQALIELLPNCQRERYRFRVEVRFDSTTLGGSVGAYVCSQPCLPGGQFGRTFYMINYNDITSNADAFSHIPATMRALPGLSRHVPKVEKHAGIGFYIAGPATDGTCSISYHHGIGASPPFLIRGSVGMWRTLEFDVADDGIHPRFDGQAMGAVNAEAMTKTLIDINSEKKRSSDGRTTAGVDLTPVFTPKGGVGVYVNSGSASFRAAVLEPLP